MNTDIQTIHDAEILSEEHLKTLKSVSESITEGFNHRQRFRPRFLMETAVLNDMKFPTPDAKYWQGNVERDTHFRNLVMLSFDYREKVADIAILEAEIKEYEKDDTHLWTKPWITKKAIQIERETAILTYMQKEARERVREIMNWSDIMQKLKPDMEYSAEDVEQHMPAAYAIRYGREMEAMQTAGAMNASDLSGAMNIISISKSIGTHKSVRALIEEKTKEP